MSNPKSKIQNLQTAFFVSGKCEVFPKTNFHILKKHKNVCSQVLGALAMIDDGELDWLGILVSLREAVTWLTCGVSVGISPKR